MRGAAFSGGGFYGNVIVGMLEQLADDPDFEPWDCMTGISTGALIISKLAEYPKDRFSDAVVAVRDLYTPRVTKDVHRAWLMGKLAALWKPSLRSSRPLAQLIRDEINVEAIRSGPYKIGVGVSNLEAGAYQLLTPELDNFAEAVEASASLPAFFEPVRVYGNGLSVDGGAMLGCDIGNLIRWGCDQVDVFMAIPEAPSFRSMEDPETLDVALRTFELMAHTLTWRQVKTTQLYNDIVKSGKDTDKKHVRLRVFAPDRLVGNAMIFDPQQAVELQEIGRKAVWNR